MAAKELRFLSALRLYSIPNKIASKRNIQSMIDMYKVLMR